MIFSSMKTKNPILPNLKEVYFEVNTIYCIFILEKYYWKKIIKCCSKKSFIQITHFLIEVLYKNTTFEKSYIKILLLE